MYAAQMKGLMPVGLPKHFEGDISLVSGKPYPYGFYEVEVTTPKDVEIEYPPLQTKVNTPDGVRTVSPLGTWTDVYSTTEIYNAMDHYGYKFKILRGVLFERAFV